MARKRLSEIFEFFEDRAGVLIIGLLSWVYFLARYIFKTTFLAEVLPPLSPLAFGYLAIAVLVAQTLAWRSLRLFHKDGFKYKVVWLLFFCEFGALLFAASFISWPFYAIVEKFQHPY